MPVKIAPLADSAYAYPLLIKNLLKASMVCVPYQEISYQDKCRYTYKTFYERLCRLANGLSRFGVKAGQTVAVMDWDSHRYLESYFAIPMMGAILQTINMRLSTEQVLYTVNHTKADVLLVNREFFPLLAAIASRLENVRHFILIDDKIQNEKEPVNFACEYEQMLAESPTVYDFPDFDENALATTFFTTGTTGLPKGVYFSHRQLVLHTLAVATMMGSSYAQGHLHREDVYMPMTPMFHVHAWGFPYVATMLGMRQVYPGRYLPESLLKLIQNEKVTFSHCVPSVLQMLFNHPGSEEADLSKWKIIIGGSVMSEALAQAAMQRGIDVITGYGMSETCPVLTITNLQSEDMADSVEHQMRLRCKTGRPLPLVDLRVVTPDMQDVPPDGKTAGEIIVRSPWLTSGYVADNISSEKLWAGGYLHTQDTGTIDEKGYLRITDRIKDVIKTTGEWVSSLELEDIVAKHEAVQEVAVIGIPDERWGERPLALVVLKPELQGQVTPQSIRSFTTRLAKAAGISRYSLLVQIKFVDSLVKTSVGKLSKREMREAYISKNM